MSPLVNHRRSDLAQAVGIALAVSLLGSLASCGSLGQGRPRANSRLYPVLIPPRTVGAPASKAVHEHFRARGHVDFAHSPPGDLVQLQVRDSFYSGSLAVHPLFLVYDGRNGRWEQWETWSGDLYGWHERVRASRRKRSDGGEEVKAPSAVIQYGTLRRIVGLTYLEHQDRDRIRGEWTGSEARRIIDVLQRPLTYPHVDDYRLWPGPNSNTYAAWVLEQARVPIDLDPRMVGKDWRGLSGMGVGLASARTGIRADMLGLGLALGLREGIEVHLLGATLGLDLWPPALKTPLGRLGFAE